MRSALAAMAIITTISGPAFAGMARPATVYTPDLVICASPEALAKQLRQTALKPGWPWQGLVPGRQIEILREIKVSAADGLVTNDVAPAGYFQEWSSGDLRFHALVYGTPESACVVGTAVERR